MWEDIFRSPSFVEDNKKIIFKVPHMKDDQDQPGTKTIEGYVLSDVVLELRL